jgi:hypothetical protein
MPKDDETLSVYTADQVANGALVLGATPYFQAVGKDLKDKVKEGLQNPKG